MIRPRTGFTELVSVPWQDPAAFVTAAEELADFPASSIAADGHPAFGADAAEDLIGLRLALSAPERADLGDLGQDAAAALQSALSASWRPGERDLDIQARCAAPAEAAGADTPVLIVGGDDRLAQVPPPDGGRRLGAPPGHGGSRGPAGRPGTWPRHDSRRREPPDSAYRDLRRRVLTIEDAVLSASRPGARYGDALSALDAAYARSGAPGGVGWSLPGRPDRLRAARVRARSRPGRCPLVPRADRGWSRCCLESQPAGWREGRGHLPGDPCGRARASDPSAGLAGGTRRRPPTAAPRSTGGRHVTDGSQALTLTGAGVVAAQRRSPPSPRRPRVRPGSPTGLTSASRSRAARGRRYCAPS